MTTTCTIFIHFVITILYHKINILYNYYICKYGCVGEYVVVVVILIGV